MTVDDHLRALADNVRASRERFGLSLAQLAERSGVAKATLFKVEQGQGNPTLDTISAIADTFGLAVPVLLEPAAPAAVSVVRADEGEDTSDDASVSRLLRRQALEAGVLEVYAQRFRPGASDTSISHGPGSREHVYVISGRLALGPEGEQVELGPGDFASYRSDRVHRWSVVEGEPEILILNTHARPSTSGG